MGRNFGMGLWRCRRQYKPIVWYWADNDPPRNWNDNNNGHNHIRSNNDNSSLTVDQSAVDEASILIIKYCQCKFNAFHVFSINNSYSFVFYYRFLDYWPPVHFMKWMMVRQNFKFRCVSDISFPKLSFHIEIWKIGRIWYTKDWLKSGQIAHGIMTANSSVWRKNRQYVYFDLLPNQASDQWSNQSVILIIKPEAGRNSIEHEISYFCQYTSSNGHGVLCKSNSSEFPSNASSKAIIFR